jgi:predicted nuclease of restriction endonuclease-like (RecB) superfamily
MANINFRDLVESISYVHNQVVAQAGKAVNISLTLRNWMIGLHISEFELRGVDRATYGDNLLSDLAESLTKLKVSNCNRRQLYRYLRFYRIYPGIVGTLPPQFKELLPSEIFTVEKVGTVSPQLNLPPEQVIERLSYSHFELLLDVDNPIKRSFYEIECIRGSWSVRELKRQIASLYFERSGLSQNKEKLAEMVQRGLGKTEPKLTIRDPYIFEFLEIKSKEVMGESDLEDALLDKLQEFLLELGHGFCFEARQKRILIGERHGFIDLVFYHRILKCHVLLELKVGEFSHEHIGQLNTYVSWYQKNVFTHGDNPPVGILLCTQKDHALVEYALAGMSNQLFVSKYQMQLPGKEEMQRFVEEQIRKELGAGMQEGK